ncbi:MAG: aminotransferase class V-fold PLP-dependent enzyme, partial [Jiangellaceae bacterium]
AASWGPDPNIEILGNVAAERLSIVSFVIRNGERYLHHNYVVALLNDMFGIQSRGGCSCAGPYGHRLLGIDIERSHRFEAEILAGVEGIKPGWVRVNFNYFISEPVFSYIVDAVHMIAEYGWRLLPDYQFEPATGLWRHRKGPVEPPLRLSQLAFDDTGHLTYPKHHDRAPLTMLQHYLEEARQIFEAAPPEPDLAGRPPGVSDDFEKLRWFDLPVTCVS